MKKTQKNYQNDCIECDISTAERLNYFTGQFLTERDFSAEQEYQIGKNRQHNRYLHGYGTVCGLKVVQHPHLDCRDRFIIIEPGLALDCCGREIWVREPVYVDIVKALAPQINDPTLTGKHLLISLCYTECKTEYVPALYSDCGCDTTGYEANRIFEGFEVDVQLIDKLPKPHISEPFGVNLNWVSTINLAQASRLVLDTGKKRLYVLTSANPSQIAIYDTTNYLLLGSIAIGTNGVQGVDMAIAPSGRYLYIICYGEGATDNYSLKVIDVENPATPVNNLTLTSGALTSPPQVVVSPADGRIYTLDINADPKKLIVWKTEINTTSGIDPNSAKDLEITNTSHPGTILNDPQAITVSPDGKWLLIADGAGNQIQISKTETLKLPLDSQVTYSINLGESPSLLAVAGDSSLLYTVTTPPTGDKKVRAFRITEEPPAFPEIRAVTATSLGVTIGTETPIAITASNSGQWAYVVSKDDSNKGKVRVINGEKIATLPINAVSEPIEVIGAPEDILLDTDKSTLYVAGKGTTQPGGGVSVLDVKEEACQEIVWRALEGCPECPEDFCVPLAVVQEYTKNQVINDADIDNRIRPLVTSTENLRKLVMCALETKVSQDGVSKEDLETLQRLQAEFAAELATLRGRIDTIEARLADLEDRTANFESDLTRIVALSWEHNTSLNPPILINRLGDRQAEPGFVIGFGKEINTLTEIDISQIDERVFQVLIAKPEANNPSLVCRCAIQGEVIPVTFELATDERGNIIPGQIQRNSVKESDSKKAPGVAFTVNEKILSEFNEIWILLRGDFVVDGDKKAIDAEFLRGKLPTGNRPQSSKFGIQGGLFESWFWISETRPKFAKN